MIYIVRHGQTELNSRRVLQGRSDHPLNRAGIAQAEEAALRLKDVSFSAVYSSPLKRAVQTAQILVPGRQPILDERLIEMDYGPYEEMDLSNPDPEVLAFFRDFVHRPAPAGMEPLEQVILRTGAFMEEHCRKQDDILISTHAIAMKGILEYLTPESGGRYWSSYIGNCAIYTLDYRDGAFTVPAPMGGSA